MVTLKRFSDTDIQIPEHSPDSDDKLLLIDDATFVSAFAEAGQRCGMHLVCARCSHPGRPLRAVLLLLDDAEGVDEAAGSVGFCRECYQDLSELMFHDAVLRAAKLH